jgi:hypothetical protein
VATSDFILQTISIGHSPSRLDNGGFFPKLSGMSFANQPLVIAGRSFRSRLILGTGKFSSPEAARNWSALRRRHDFAFFAPL